jgi:hypothetical protein
MYSTTLPSGIGRYGEKIRSRVGAATAQASGAGVSPAPGTLLTAVVGAAFAQAEQ